VAVMSTDPTVHGDPIDGAGVVRTKAFIELCSQGGDFRTCSVTTLADTNLPVRITKRMSVLIG